VGPCRGRVRAAACKHCRHHQHEQGADLHLPTLRNAGLAITSLLTATASHYSSNSAPNPRHHAHLGLIRRPPRRGMTQARPPSAVGAPRRGSAQPVYADRS
jgi:hypothetical protein